MTERVLDSQVGDDAEKRRTVSDPAGRHEVSYKCTTLYQPNPPTAIRDCTRSADDVFTLWSAVPITRTKEVANVRCERLSSVQLGAGYVSESDGRPTRH